MILSVILCDFLKEELRMNIAVIFAGGTGQRMNTKTRPKQFLELHGKPIIIYTLEKFENHSDIDFIIVVCLESWIPFLQKMIKRFSIEKVVDIVPGGNSGQESIKNGIDCAWNRFPGDSTVLIHDGVRPLIDDNTISACLDSVAQYGNAITVVPAIETVIQESDGVIRNIIDRKTCQMAKAPQCFLLKDLREAHLRACRDNLEDFIDSASLMSHYGHILHVVEGSPDNIKITTPSDFYVFRAYVDVAENSQIFG